jgi:hypothetical protein
LLGSESFPAMGRFEMRHHSLSFTRLNPVSSFLLVVSLIVVVLAVLSLSGCANAIGYGEPITRNEAFLALPLAITCQMATGKFCL